jgi:Flp pilus assembly protein TadB
VSTHTHRRGRPAPSAGEAWPPVRRLALLAAVALLVAELASAFAGILVSVVGLAALAAYAAATSDRS